MVVHMYTGTLFTCIQYDVFDNLEVFSDSTGYRLDSPPGRRRGMPTRNASNNHSGFPSVFIFAADDSLGESLLSPL